MFITVSNHALELGPAVGCAALRSVDIFTNHNMTVALGILIASLKLALNGSDTGQREEYKCLGFAESELLVEFGYPTQRLILPPKQEKGKMDENVLDQK